MIETVIFVASFLLLGGTIKFMCKNNSPSHSAEYYRYLRDNKNVIKKDDHLYL